MSASDPCVVDTPLMDKNRLGHRDPHSHRLQLAVPDDVAMFVASQSKKELHFFASRVA